ncbi:hypothetical protein C8F01DRAFT_1155357 [Mycena amicta]|nr:hypothetical protein C8F01DRAFT_1155357 [Mycena amicta]
MSSPASSLFAIAELVEQVVDYSYADTPTLLACVYVGRTWVVPAQFHLFETLDIKSEPACKRLSEAISTAPYLASYMRTLRIHFPYSVPLVSLEKLQLPMLRTLVLANCPNVEQMKRVENLITLPSVKLLRMWSSPSTRWPQLALLAQMRRRVDILQLSSASETVADEDAPVDGAAHDSLAPIRVAHLHLTGRVIRNVLNLISSTSAISPRIPHLTFDSPSAKSLAALLSSIGRTLTGLSVSVSLLLGAVMVEPIVLLRITKNDRGSEHIPEAEPLQQRKWLAFPSKCLPALRYLRFYDVAVSNECGLESDALEFVNAALEQMSQPAFFQELVRDDPFLGEQSTGRRARNTSGRGRGGGGEKKPTVVNATPPIELEDLTIHISLRPYPRDCNTRGSDYPIEPAPNTPSSWRSIDKALQRLAGGAIPSVPYRLSCVRVDRDERAMIDGQPTRLIEGGRAVRLMETEREKIRAYLPRVDELGLIQF